MQDQGNSSAVQRAYGPRRSTGRAVSLSLIVVSLLTAWTAWATAVRADTPELTKFLNAYPGVSSSKLNNCLLCHTTNPTGGALNPYGRDYKNAGRRFPPIEPTDSDRDGYSNIAEINARTWPGNPADVPAAAPTATPTRTFTATANVTSTPTQTASPTPTSTVTPTSTTTGVIDATPTTTSTDSVIQTGTPTDTTAPAPPTPTPTQTVSAPAVRYILIAWNDLGMHCMNESFANLAVLPPYNTLWAQLIYLDEWPEVIADGVTVEYSIVDNTYSAGKTDFWDYAADLFGITLQPNVGLKGATLAGEMRAEGDHFIVEGIPLTPYRDSAPNVAYPYQLAHLVARDNLTGEILAETTTVVPVSTEMHCEVCHSDGMREGIATGNVETNILSLHDREEGTDLMNRRPVLCAGCHGSNALGLAGDPSLPNLSRAIHGRHAPGGNGGDVGAPEDGTDDCYLCHPGQQTQCLRDVMYAAGMTCIDCHGGTAQVADATRQPWIDLPRCGSSSCHGAKYAEEPGTLYRNSAEHGGLYCEACHGSPHAIVPSTQPNDNIQNIALQGYAGALRECTVCHDGPPAATGPHGLRALAHKLSLPLIWR